MNIKEIDEKLSKLSELEINILYYCKTPKALRRIARNFKKNYWYIDHIMNDLFYDDLIKKESKGRNKMFNTPLDIVYRVEEEMKRRRDETV